MQNKSLLAILVILMPLVISIAISMDIFVPSVPDIGLYFNTTPQIVQWTLTVYMIGAGISQLLSGPLTDRFGRRPCILIALILYSIGTSICLFSWSIEMLIIGRLFQSLGSSILIVAAYAIVRDLYSTEKSAIIYSLLGSITMLAPVLAPLWGGFLSTLFNSWRASFAFLMIFAIYSFISSYYFILETLPPRKKISIKINKLISNYAHVMKNREFQAHSFITLTAMIALFCFCALSPFFLIQELHLAKIIYGLCFGSNALSYIIGSLLSNYLSRRLSGSTSILLGLLFSVAGSTYMFIVNLSYGLSVANFMLPMLILSFGLGLSFGPATAKALASFSDFAGSASALLTSIQFLGSGIIGSIIMYHNVSSAIPFASVMLVFTMLSTFIYLTKNIKSFL